MQEGLLSTPPWGQLVLKLAPLSCSEALLLLLCKLPCCKAKLCSKFEISRLKIEAKCFTKLEADQAPRAVSHIQAAEAACLIPLRNCFLDKLLLSSCASSHQNCSKLLLKSKLLKVIAVKLLC